MKQAPTLMTLMGIFCLFSGVQSLRGGTQTITLSDRREIKVLTAKPKVKRRTGNKLCIVLSPGPGTEKMAEMAMTNLGRNLANRNWFVAAPISPDGQPFFGENGAIIPECIRIIQRNPGIAKGKVLLAGISNGGIAAIEIASDQPDLFVGVVALPGFVRPDKDLGNLRNMPVFFRVGAQDELTWNQVYQSSVDQLRNAGARLDSKLVPEAKHIFRINWEDLDSWLGEVLTNAKPGGFGSSVRDRSRR